MSFQPKMSVGVEVVYILRDVLKMENNLSSCCSNVRTAGLEGNARHTPSPKMQ